VNENTELVSIDPGLKGCGMALWKGGLLQKALYVPNVPGGDFQEMQGRIVQLLPGFPVKISRDFLLAIELPQVYVTSRAKGDPNDLINLAVLVGALAQTFREPQLFKPFEWKRNTPKPVMEGRILKRLSASEKTRIVLPIKSLAHNVIDAIGIGLHALGRLR